MIKKHFKSIKKGIAAAATAASLRRSNQQRLAQRKRVGRSRTKTKTKTKRFRTITDDSGIGSSAHLVVVDAKKKKTAKGKWIYTQTHNEVIFSNAGTQGTQQLGMGALSQINVSSGVGYTGFQSQVAVRQLNPMLGNTGSAYLTASTAPTTDSFVISDMIFDIEMCSWSDVAQTVDMYVYVAKDGQANDVGIEWARGYQQQGSGKGAMTMLSAPLYQGVAGYGRVDEPYASPLDVKEYMNNTYRFMKKVTINLTSGATHKCKVHCVMNKLVNNSELDVDTRGSDLTIKGLTTIIMITVRGQVVDDTTAGGTAKPTFASTRVGLITRNTYVCHPVPSPISNRTVGIHSYNVPINAALAAQQLINDVDVVAQAINC
ncbi:putative capsid protein [Sewage-associated circular DNA virus-7]|uniref:Putative capsid protein n=1 Tax=Sewage-associated circular DNA virus-7 TaxID=1519396 RepID=A0A075J468_9VIRU|nr:putative capsid protein [Sewage-associated circular DNA virus-7]